MTSAIAARPNRPHAGTLADLAERRGGAPGALGLAPAHVFGSSFGGRVAQLWRMLHPPRSSALVLGSTWPLPQALPALNPAGIARMMELRAGTARERRGAGRAVLAQGLPAGPPGPARASFAPRAAASRARAAPRASAMRRRISGSAGEIGRPTLVASRANRTGSCRASVTFGMAGPIAEAALQPSALARDAAHAHDAAGVREIRLQPEPCPRLTEPDPWQRGAAGADYIRIEGICRRTSAAARQRPRPARHRLHHRARQLRHHRRAQRLRQEHAAAHPRRACSTTSVGSVVLDGQPIHGTRRDVGVVFQSSILLPWRTILENVHAAGRGARPRHEAGARTRAMQLLEMVRPRRLRAQAAAPAERRHAAARLDRAGPAARPQDPADGRAVRRARRA